MLPYTTLLDQHQLTENEKLIITNDAKNKLVRMTANAPIYVLGFIGASRLGKSSIANGLSLYLSSITKQPSFKFPAGSTDTPVTVGINAGFICKNEQINNINIPNNNYVILDCEGMDHRCRTSEGTTRFLLTFCSALCVVSAQGTKYLFELQDRLFSGLPAASDDNKEDDKSITFCDTLIYIMNRGQSFLDDDEFEAAFNNPKLNRLKNQFPHRIFIDIDTFNVSQGTGKSKKELKRMNQKERDSLIQNFVEGEFKKVFETEAWPKMSAAMKPAMLSNKHLSGQQVLDLMVASCKQFNDGGYVALNKESQTAFFTEICNDYKRICVAAYDIAMQSLKRDRYKIQIGTLQLKHHENKVAAEHELDACFNRGILAIRNNEILDTVKRGTKAALGQEIGDKYTAIISYNNNKKILPPMQSFDDIKLPENYDKYVAESIIDNGRYVQALKYVSSDYNPSLGTGHHSTAAGWKEDIFNNAPDSAKLFNVSGLNARTILSTKIPGKWDRHISKLNVVPFGKTNFWGVECDNLTWKGHIYDVKNGIFEHEQISQNRNYNTSFTVSNTRGKQMNFNLSAARSGNGGSGGISLNESETQSLTQTYSYGYQVSGVDYITFDAKADITLSVNRKTFLYSSAKKASLGTEGDGNARNDTKSKTFTVTLKLKIPSGLCSYPDPAQ